VVLSSSVASHTCAKEIISAKDNNQKSYVINAAEFVAFFVYIISLLRRIDQCFALKYLSASSAAMQPLPAAVTA
jgi:hypothetical protein